MRKQNPHFAALRHTLHAYFTEILDAYQLRCVTPFELHRLLERCRLSTREHPLNVLDLAVERAHEVMNAGDR